MSKTNPEDNVWGSGIKICERKFQSTWDWNFQGTIWDFSETRWDTFYCKWVHSSLILTVTGCSLFQGWISFCFLQKEGTSFHHGIPRIGTRTICRMIKQFLLWGKSLVMTKTWMISSIPFFNHAFICSLLRINRYCVNGKSESCHGLKLKNRKKIFF